jgi:hypothetical protein
MRRLSKDQAARITLGAQGLTAARPAGRVDVRHFRRTLARMGLLQLDSVNVLARSHYLPVFSRLGAYDVGRFDRWTARSGELFEYWGHMASLLPVEDHPLFRWRMEAIEPWRQIKEIERRRPGYVEAVYREVRERGPLTVADLSDGGERTGSWWGYAPGKIALEWLFDSGRLTAYRNGSFTRFYDLPQRVIDPGILCAEAVPREAAYRVLLERSARYHGVGTAADLLDYYRLRGPLALKTLAALAAAGDLERVEVDGWKGPVYLHPEATMPRRSGTALLSPFDPLVWNRDRVERIFDFFYRIEIYVPAPKRIHGYYVLPFLMDGRLVGRVDLKADRAAGSLLVRGSFAEPDVDRVAVAGALAAELVEMASWLGLATVAVERNGDLAQPLSRRL